MKHLLCFIYMLFSLPFLVDAATVLVTIEPYQYLVEEIAQDTVEVKSFITGSINIHDYEPTIRQMQEAYTADIWFKIGELFEDKLEKRLVESSASLKVVSLFQGLDLLSSGCKHHHHHDSNHDHPCNIDPHIWLSFKQLKKQVMTISQALQNISPEYSGLYKRNAQRLIETLNRLDQYWSAKFKEVNLRQLYLVHPAFAYLCHDYKLEQVALEHHGQELSQRQFASIYYNAKEIGVQVIFSQPGYRSKSAVKMADLLNLEIIEVNPYDKNVIENLNAISQHFYNSLKQQ